MTNTISDQPQLIIDTREQEGYDFPSLPCVRGKLDAGDYSIVGHEHRVAVERKSLADFVHTIIKQRARFYRELTKLQSYESACIVVEGDYQSILCGHYQSGAHPNSLIGSIMSIIIDFGIPIYFLGNRQAARHFTENYLVRYWRTSKNEIEQVESQTGKK